MGNDCAGYMSMYRLSKDARRFVREHHVGRRFVFSVQKCLHQHFDIDGVIGDYDRSLVFAAYERDSNLDFSFDTLLIPMCYIILTGKMHSCKRVIGSTAVS